MWQEPYLVDDKEEAVQKWLAMILVMFLITACGGTTQETPVQQCNRDCDRQPLNSSHCDSGNPQTLMQRRIIPEDDIGSLRGLLTFHRGAKGKKDGTAERCRNISWVTFTPDADNTTPFRVIMVISAGEERQGVSVMTNLTNTTSTIGFYTGARTSVNGCVARLDERGNKVGTNACLKSIPVNPDIVIKGE